MDEVRALLRLLGSKRRDVVPRRGISGWMIVLLGLYALFYVASCASAIGDLTAALHAGRWDSDTDSWLKFFSQGIVPGLFAVSCFTLFLDSIRSGFSKRQLYAAARILRFVAAGNDDSLVPTATWLLDGLRNEPISTVPATFGPLPPITVASADGYSLIGGSICTVGVLLATIGLLLATAAPSSERGGYAIGCAVLGFITISIGIVLLRVAARLRRPLTILTDEAGLCWTAPGRDAAAVCIKWSEARAFFVIQYVESVATFNRHVAFVLDAPDTTLIWDERTTNKAEALGVSDSLCALILARTGLPLRDLTGIAVKLTAPRWKPAYASLPEAFWQPLPGHDPTLPTLPAPTTRWKPARPALYVELPMLLLLAVLSAVGFILPH